MRGSGAKLTLALLAELEDHISAGALHNSAERFDAPKCHPETRVAVQDEVFSWICDGDRDDEPKGIMWVTCGSRKDCHHGLSRRHLPWEGHPRCYPFLLILLLGRQTLQAIFDAYAGVSTRPEQSNAPSCGEDPLCY
jgi:hypothetical protein